MYSWLGEDWLTFSSNDEDDDKKTETIKAFLGKEKKLNDCNK